MTDISVLAVKFTSEGGNKVVSDMERLRNSGSRTEQQINSLVRATSALRRLLALGVGGMGLNAYLQMADQMQSLNAQLKFVTGSQREFNTAQKELFSIAQNTRASLDATTKLYVKSSRALKDYGYQQKDILKFTDSINKAMAVGGVGAEEQASALLQLSQALGSGQLQGDEFKSISEAAPIILDTLAEYMGKSRAEIKKLASEGQLTSKVIVDAFSASGEKIDEQFKSMPLTFGGAMQQLKNAMLQFVGEIDSSSGFSGAIAQGISFLADNFGILAKTLGYATAAYVAYNAVSFATDFKKATGGVGLLSASFGKLTSMIRGATVAMLANPLGALVVAITGAAYAFDVFMSDVSVSGSQFGATWGDVAIGVFQDFKQVVGNISDWFIDSWNKATASASSSFDSFSGTVFSVLVGIVDQAKTNTNILIGAFKAAKDSIVIAWSDLPSAFSSLGKTAINGLIRIVELGINHLLDAVKEFLGVFNSAMESVGIDGIFDTSGFKIELPKLALDQAETQIKDQLGNAVIEAFSTDYVGNAIDGVMDYLVKAGDKVAQANNPQGLDSISGNSFLPSISGTSGSKLGGTSGSKSGGKNYLKEWNQYFDELNRSNADTWTRIGLEEARSMQDMLEKAKKANIGYEEIEKAKTLIHERYAKERLEIAEKYVPSLRYERELKEQLREINELQKESIITAQQASNAILALGDKYNPVLSAQREYLDNMKEITLLEQNQILSAAQADKARKDQEWEKWKKTADQNDPLNGIKLSFKTFGDEASDIMNNVANITSKGLNGMNDALTDFVMTGKADFRGLAQSIIKDITAMIIKMTIFNALKSAFGGTTFGDFLGLPSHATGGLVGDGYYNGGLVGFNTGGFTGYGGKYEPAGIVHRGEYVITKEATSRLGRSFLDQLNYGKSSGFSSGGSVGNQLVSLTNNPQKSSINVKIINNGTPVDAKVTQEDKEDGANIIVELMSKMKDVADESFNRNMQLQMRAGGMLSR